MKTVNFSVMLTIEEREKLQRIADETGRKPGEVVRRLLVLADAMPQARRLLGMPTNNFYKIENLTITRINEKTLEETHENV